MITRDLKLWVYSSGVALLAIAADVGINWQDDASELNQQVSVPAYEINLSDVSALTEQRQQQLKGFVELGDNYAKKQQQLAESETSQPSEPADIPMADDEQQLANKAIRLVAVFELKAQVVAIVEVRDLTSTQGERHSISLGERLLNAEVIDIQLNRVVLNSEGQSIELQLFSRQVKS